MAISSTGNEEEGHKDSDEDVEGHKSHEISRNDSDEDNIGEEMNEVHGLEVFLGNIPPDISRANLRNICETIVGEVLEVRLKGRYPRPYAFLTFGTKELTFKAIKELDGRELNGQKLRCYECHKDNQLLIGNVPRSWGNEDLKNELMGIGPGVLSVQLLKDTENLGTALVRYRDRCCADVSREKLLAPEFKFGDKVPSVSWARYRGSDYIYSSQGKAIFVEELPRFITIDRLRQSFEHHGPIAYVTMSRNLRREDSRFGFVYFAEKSCAAEAVKENYTIDGKVLKCRIAHPNAKYFIEQNNVAHVPNYVPQQHGYYGAYAHDYGALNQPLWVAQPQIYGYNGYAPEAATMIPYYQAVGYLVYQPLYLPVLPQPQGRYTIWLGESSNNEIHNNYSFQERGRESSNRV